MTASPNSSANKAKVPVHNHQKPVPLRHADMPPPLAINNIRFVLFLGVVLTVVFSIRSSAKLEFRVVWSHDNAVAPLRTSELEVLSNSSEIAIHNTSRTSHFCQNSECWKRLTESLGLVRSFPDRHDQAWIVQDKSKVILFDHTSNRTYSDAGILYVKTFKAASTTGAGVALRLAVRLVSSTKNDSSTSSSRARVRSYHTPGFTYRDRHPTRSFLFTSVRDPASRALSRIFYTKVSYWGSNPHDDKLILGYLHDTDPQFGSVRHVGGGYQVWYTSTEGDRLPRSWGPKQPTKVQRPQAIESAVKQILHDYDFILLAERLDESIVVMAMLMNVSLDDVLVQNAKESSSSSWYFFKVRKTQLCRKPVRVFRSPAIIAYLESDEWLAKNYGDYLLHIAANLSLDATIERLGRDRVEKALHVYRSLQDQVVQECRNQTIYHCSASGKPQTSLSKHNCYTDDR
jgi:hypothetical protein